VGAGDTGEPAAARAFRARLAFDSDVHRCRRIAADNRLNEQRAEPPSIGLRIGPSDASCLPGTRLTIAGSAGISSRGHRAAQRDTAQSRRAWRPRAIRRYRELAGAAGLTIGMARIPGAIRCCRIGAQLNLRRRWRPHSQSAWSKNAEHSNRARRQFRRHEAPRYRLRGTTVRAHARPRRHRVERV